MNGIVQSRNGHTMIHQHMLAERAVGAVNPHALLCSSLVCIVDNVVRDQGLSEVILV